MTPFPFADAPGRKKSLHENVYQFPIAQLQVVDLVVKKELDLALSEERFQIVNS